MDELRTADDKIFATIATLVCEYMRGDETTLKKVPKRLQPHFTALLGYIRSKCSENLSDLEKMLPLEGWTESQLEILLEEFRLMRKPWVAKENKFEYMSWRVDVTLSTNYLTRVMKPEIQLRLKSAEQDMVFNVTDEQISELRRQAALLLRDEIVLDANPIIKNIN